MIPLQSYVIFTDSSLYIEILVIAILVALIGAGVYTVLYFSMRYDRIDKIAANIEKNPWEELSVQDADEKPKPQTTITKKWLIIKLIQVAAIVIPLILLILAIKFVF